MDGAGSGSIAAFRVVSTVIVAHADGELKELLGDALLRSLCAPLRHDVLVVYLAPPLRLGADAVREAVQLHLEKRAHGEARVLVVHPNEGSKELRQLCQFFI